MEKRILAALLTTIIVLIGLCIWIYLWVKSPTDVTITRYQKDRITYLVFGNGTAVVNYTSDSMEYEFLHPPTTTYAEDTSKAQ